MSENFGADYKGPHCSELNISVAAKGIANGESIFSHVFFRLYERKRLRKLVLRTILKLEGGQIFSRTFRDILKAYHHVEIGDYSYGPCLYPANYLRGCSTGLPAGTRVGRYCSLAANITVYRRNHPIERMTQHPFFYNSSLGIVKKDTINQDQDNPLEIGHDVWLSNGVTILPSCQSIGNGAIVGAGAVVSRNVEPYSIVAGVPARHLKYRFRPELIEQLEDSKWWEWDLLKLLKLGTGLLKPWNGF